MAKEKNLDIVVYYCSDESVRGTTDKQFGVAVKWDIPLLEGYNYAFLKNHSWKPSIKNGFWGLINFSLIQALRQAPKSYLIVPGWQYFSYVIAIISGYLLGHKVCIRVETPLNQERQKHSLTAQVRKWGMRYLLFPLVSKFLYIGKENRDFYLYYGLQEHDLIFTPYAVDNSRFRQAYESHLPFKQQLKAQLQLPLDKKIILFSGKYISKKRPLDIIQAFAKMPQADKCLVMVGEGELRPLMEQLIKQLNLTDVYLTGFVNQSQIPLYYTIADIFVMFSDLGETWGLSTNEAMNFALPVVLSDLTGCARDLVAEGENGFIIKTGDIEALADKLTLLLQEEELRVQAGQKSLEKIQQYSYEVIIENLKRHLV